MPPHAFQRDISEGRLVELSIEGQPPGGPWCPRSPTRPGMIAHCAARLERFKVPKRIIFADTLPKNPSGKLLKRELRKRYEQ
jgi:acyl-CoA synthetase (AMP-forming)/AMP-acid ligase II